MEQRAILSSRQDLTTIEALTRNDIRARLERPRLPKPRGDVATAMALMAQGALEPHNFDQYGQVPSTGIPYTQGAGAPGVKVKCKPAAVLVPLIESSNGFSVLLTKRTRDLKQHAGQVAFPGGRMEPEDADAVSCALRETEEETGLPRQAVEVLGRV
jgi:hypothetical protein